MITRQQARQDIAKLIQQYQQIPKEDRPNLTEANVLHQLIEPLLQALGWPMKDPTRCKYELNTQVGRPDVVLLPESGGASLTPAVTGWCSLLKSQERTWMSSTSFGSSPTTASLTAVSINSLTSATVKT